MDQLRREPLRQSFAQLLNPSSPLLSDNGSLGNSIISAVDYVRGRIVGAPAEASAPGHGFHRLDEFGYEC
jgi:hypothetical protein